jgi:cytochrome P450
MYQYADICNRLYELAQTRNAENVMLDLNDVPVLLIQRFEEADQVLRTNFDNYQKNMQWFRQTLGRSRFSEDGAQWVMRRNLTQPYFNSFDRQRVFEITVPYARKILGQLIARSAEGAATIEDLTLRRLTASVAIENFLDIKLEDTSIDLSLLTKLVELVSEYSFIPAGQAKAFYQEHLARLLDLRREILASLRIFRNGDVPETPMLAGMRAADRDPATGFVLEHEMLTFLASGTETSATTIGWMCHVLATHPSLQDELRGIALDFWKSGQPDWEHLSPLEPLAHLISETIRLYPPTPILSRLAVGSDRLGGHEIEAGQSVMISLAGISHDRRLRENPWEYDAGKGAGSWAAGRKTAFSFGPRICGGKQFALAELMTVATVFLAHARFEPTSDEPVRFFWKSQLQREGGHRVRVVPIH